MKFAEKQKRFVARLSLILLSLAISSCRTPPDVFVFEEFAQTVTKDPVTDHLMLEPALLCIEKINEPACCHGVSIVKGREIFVGEDPKHLFYGKTCSRLKRESIMLPAVESYAPLATFTINECKRNNCDKKITPFKIKLDGLNGIGEIIKRSQQP